MLFDKASRNKIAPFMNLLQSKTGLSPNPLEIYWRECLGMHPKGNAPVQFSKNLPDINVNAEKISNVQYQETLLLFIETVSSAPDSMGW